MGYHYLIGNIAWNKGGLIMIELDYFIELVEKAIELGLVNKNTGEEIL